MNIAVIIGKMSDSGVDRVMISAFCRMTLPPESVTFVYYADSPLEADSTLTAAGYRFIAIAPPQKLSQHKETLKALFSEQHFDVLWDCCGTLSVFALKIAKQQGIAVRILHNHTASSYREPVRNLAKTLLRPFAVKYATDYCACGSLAARYMFGEARTAEGQVHIFTNGINSSEYIYNEDFRSSMRSMLGVKPDELLVGCVGRLESQKNQILLLKSMRIVRKYSSKIRLVLVGEGSMRQRLAAYCSKHGLDNCVIFAGSCDCTKMYSAFDVFALPSIYEGLPLTVIEAQKNGLYCILSDRITPECVCTPDVEALPLTSKAFAGEILRYYKTGEPKRRQNTVLLPEFEIEKMSGDMENFLHKKFSDMSARG